MSPYIHGRIYPEIESSTLLRHDFRILIDPQIIGSDGVKSLIDLDTLRQYLSTISGQPCHLSLLAPAAQGSNFSAQHEIIRRYGGEILSYSSILLPKAVEAFGPSADQHPELLALVSTALASDADIIITNPPSDLELKDLCQKLSILFGDWKKAKTESEVFVRGHEVPWSFRLPMWGCPWTPFYITVEPNTELVELYRSTQESALSSETVELIRSLALNRHSSLSYTRDKLLFYVQQQRAAKRNNLRRQDFSFECGYFLNHYYILFWAGLDQVCWIVNDIFGLGFTRKDWRSVGILNERFLKVLSENQPAISTIFKDAKFTEWVKVLRSARHFVAHQGFTMPSELYLKPKVEPTEEELDREIETSDEWLDLKKLLPSELLEAHRPTLRLEARLRRYDRVPERVLRLKIDGEEVLIFPLLNIEHDFATYSDFASKIASAALAHLNERK